jgi:hypothetical protein
MANLGMRHLNLVIFWISLWLIPDDLSFLTHIFFLFPVRVLYLSAAGRNVSLIFSNICFKNKMWPRIKVATHHSLKLVRICLRFLWWRDTFLIEVDKLMLTAEFFQSQNIQSISTKTIRPRCMWKMPFAATTLIC